MKYAINLNPLLPIRSDASERTEMITQLLFGEYCQVLEEKDSFVKIKNSFDNYSGWADKKMLTEISAKDYADLHTQEVYRTFEPVADVFCINDKSIYRFSAGSLLPNYNPEDSKFGIGNNIFQIHPSYVTYLPENKSNIEGIIPIALSLLNTPYLWGGKNVMGIDCSGLVQVVYTINGFKLPRDAYQQAEIGMKRSFEEALAGDLFFFEKNTRITHVGIYMGDGKIIHSSGKVKINTVDEKGIFSDDKSCYTHHLSLIKRIK